MLNEHEYLEVLHRGLRENPSLLNYISEDNIEIFETTERGQYFDILCECEGYPRFVLHCCRSISNFSCYLEWLD